MITAIMKGLVVTIAIVFAFVIFVTGFVQVLTWSETLFGRAAPLVVCGAVCVGTIFFFAVKYFLLKAKIEANRSGS